MKKNQGFVFIETIVVVSVLSLTLLLLFSSYSYILRKSRERNAFDTTESLYKTYYTKQILDLTKNGIDKYIQSQLGNECRKMDHYNSYVCTPQEGGPLDQARVAFEVEKIYIVNPSELYNSSSHDDWLFRFDATTIDYLKQIGGSKNQRLMIVKFKKQFNKTGGEYEVIHSSLEV